MSKQNQERKLCSRNHSAGRCTVVFSSETSQDLDWLREFYERTLKQRISTALIFRRSMALLRSHIEKAIEQSNNYSVHTETEKLKEQR